ncbi:hypothetical protein BC629DRAFT_1446128 [Irpex lacteus]|nr:hypothetical protein BC629DRAFT_1446128 [Irpex lacteus]
MYGRRSMLRTSRRHRASIGVAGPLAYLNVWNLRHGLRDRNFVRALRGSIRAKRSSEKEEKKADTDTQTSPSRTYCDPYPYSSIGDPRIRGRLERRRLGLYWLRRDTYTYNAYTTPDETIGVLTLAISPVVALDEVEPSVDCTLAQSVLRSRRAVPCCDGCEHYRTTSGQRNRRYNKDHTGSVKIRRRSPVPGWVPDWACGFSAKEELTADGLKGSYRKLRIVEYDSALRGDGDMSRGRDWLAAGMAAGRGRGCSLESGKRIDSELEAKLHTRLAAIGPSKQGAVQEPTSRHILLGATTKGHQAKTEALLKAATKGGCGQTRGIGRLWSRTVQK